MLIFFANNPIVNLDTFLFFSPFVVSIRPEPMFRSKNGSGARGGGGKDDALSVEMKRKDVEVEEKVVEITL